MERVNKDGALFKILKMVSTAPEGQLSAGYVEEAKKLVADPETTRDQIHNLFAAIHGECCGGASAFVKTLVNPDYTLCYD